jgi:2'-5' RNA ligase
MFLPAKLKMKYFIGIIPPENIYTTIKNIQQQFGDNRLEPHITIRPPVTPTNSERWLEQAEIVAALFKPFNIHLSGTGNFARRVLFIGVISEQLLLLEQHLANTLRPFEPSTGKGKAYHPHLTLGRAWCGFTKQDFIGMEQLSNDYLNNNSANFMVNAIRIYHKPFPDKGFQVLKDISLQYSTD